MRRARVTSRDVARLAEVSVNTVSLAVRNSPLVAPGTRARVLEAIDKLGYQPHAAAAALRSARSNTIAFLSARHSVDSAALDSSETRSALDVFFNQTMHAINTGAAAHGCYVLYDGFVDAEQCLGLLNSGRIDGALIDFLVPDSVLIQLVAQGAPIVLVGRDAGSIPVSFVKADEDQGAYEATRHLLVRGLRPALIAVDEEHRSALADERVRGYERALRESGIPEGRTPRVHGDYSFASGYQLGCRVLAREPRPDSLFVLNEVMAAGAMLAAQELGFRVPEDLAIATTENSPMVNYVRPRLSAVHVPMFDVAARATEMLFSLLDGSASGTLQQVVPTTFVPRESSLCPASVPTGAAP